MCIWRTTLTTDDLTDGDTDDDANVASDVPDAIDDEDEATTESAATVSNGRRIASWVLTTLACLLVLFALVAPDQLSELTPLAFIRIPVEALVGIVLLLILPPTPRRVVAIVLGAVLGVLTILKLVDMGFFIALSRPFDPVVDFAFLTAGLNFLIGEIGHVGAVIAVIVIAIIAVGLVVLMALAVGRLTRLFVQRRTGTSRVTAVLAVIWIVCAFTGVQLTTGQPLAARTAAALAYDDVRQAGTDITDQRQFAKQLAVDPIRGIPGGQLLSGLRGKNVILAFVESYGRVAIQGSNFAPPIDKILDTGTKQLQAAGFTARSAFLTSSTVGGGSWLAHSSVQSGLFINNQQKFDELEASNRTSLSGAFKQAGWRTVGDDPANITDLPNSTLYNYNKFYDALNVGYRGPKFSYATMPDQYTLAAFQRNELDKPNHQPVMAELDFVSSHSPWAPLPRMVPWNQVGDGSIFDPQPKEGTQAAQVLPSAQKLQTAYGQSIQYSLTALITYIEDYGDNNTVVVFLGDHQPASIVTGEGATRDVPITIVAHDPNVMKQVSGWGWQPGLRPMPNAPVELMSTFRGQFLSAFSK
jgi:hypothetical protein